MSSGFPSQSQAQMKSTAASPMAALPTLTPSSTRPLRLRRVNHSEEIVAGFSKLYKSESMTDVTLICSGGQTIRAHRVVLSTFSPYFKAIFEAQPFVNNPCQYPVIIIKDLGLQELKAIIEFIYKGEVSVARDKLASVLQAAKSLEVSGLSELKIENFGVDASKQGSCSPANDLSYQSSSNYGISGATLGGVGALGGSLTVSGGETNKRQSDMAEATIYGGNGPDPQLKKLRISLEGGKMSDMNDVSLSQICNDSLNGVEGVKSLLQQPPRLPQAFQQIRIQQQNSTLQQQLQRQQRLHHQLSSHHFLQQKQLQQQRQHQRQLQHRQQILQQQLQQPRLNQTQYSKQYQQQQLSKNNQANFQQFQQRIRQQLQEKQQQLLLKQLSSPNSSGSSPSSSSSSPKLTTSTLQERLLQKPLSAQTHKHNGNPSPLKIILKQSADGREAKIQDAESHDEVKKQLLMKIKTEKGDDDSQLPQPQDDKNDPEESQENKELDNDDENESLKVDESLPETDSSKSNGNKAGNTDDHNDGTEDDANEKDAIASRSDSGESNKSNQKKHKSSQNNTEDGETNADDSGGLDDEDNVDIDGNEIDESTDYNDGTDLRVATIGNLNEDDEEEEEFEVEIDKDMIFQRQQQLRLQQIQKQQQFQQQQQLQLQQMQEEQEQKLMEFHQQLQEQDMDEGDNLNDNIMGFDQFGEGTGFVGDFNEQYGGSVDQEPPPPQLTPQQVLQQQRSMLLQARGPGRPRKGNKCQDISPCPECNKVFVRPDVLKLHYRSVHLNERHPCNMCPKIFKWPGDLSKHKRTKHPEAHQAIVN